MWASNTFSSLDLDGDELCLIDARIASMAAINLRPQLKSLNLHCNLLTRVENLMHLRTLQHLDLSSNQIARMEGLDALVSLRTLNLACNLIETVKGLANLRSLTKLNLSFNNIHDMSGLYAIWGTEYSLEQLELEGNKVGNSDHVVSCLMGAHTLRRLTLRHGGADNPICHLTGYRGMLLAGLPQLHVLDNLDRAGQATVADEVLADIPGLDQYLEYLVSSNSGSVEGNILAKATPRIDAALSLFKAQPIPTPSTCVSSELDTSLAATPPRSTKGNSQAGRIEKLENQLAQLLGTRQKIGSSTESPPREKTPVKAVRYVPKHDTDHTDESDLEQSKPRRVRSRSQKKSTKIPSYSRATEASGSRTKSKVVEKSVRRCQSLTPPVSCHSASVNANIAVGDQMAGSGTDQPQKDEIEATYLQLMHELEAERERRWKAEQATKKLVDHIKDLQTKAKDNEGFQDTAVQATTHLKQALMNEREVRSRTTHEMEALTKELEELKASLVTAHQNEAAQRAALSSAEETALRAEREYLKQHAHESKKAQEASLRAAACGRELDLVRNQVKNLKGQVQQLQSLLADREQEHRKELSQRYLLGSREMQDVVGREVTAVEKRHSEEMRSQQSKIVELTKQYADLEDEFRMALQIDANRFRELQEAFERLSEESSINKQALAVITKKEDKASSMVAELTALIKEQKGRITELARSKQEQIADFKDRISLLESHVEEARRRMVSMELLKQEKTRLAAQVHAQESMIEGLKAERKLWGEELAQQGSSLAQDRGRMEAKIETQISEIKQLKCYLERETDIVKIKTKMIEDQTETIRKLKEGLVERDEAVRLAREEAITSQRELEDALSGEQAANADLQEKLEKLRDRKDELKQEVVDLRVKLDKVNKDYSSLNSHWKEKSGLIGDLEQRVSAMKANWDKKEQKLSAERDKAVDAARMAVSKLQVLDASFRQQLKSKECSQNEALAVLAREKQEEVDASNHRVLEVEAEMRALLQENNNHKRALENKLKGLSKQFEDLKGNLI